MFFFDEPSSYQSGAQANRFKKHKPEDRKNWEWLKIGGINIPEWRAEAKDTKNCACSRTSF